MMENPLTWVALSIGFIGCSLAMFWSARDHFNVGHTTQCFCWIFLGLVFVALAVFSGFELYSLRVLGSLWNLP